MTIVKQIDLEEVSIDIVLSDGLGTRVGVEIINDDGMVVVKRRFGRKKNETRIQQIDRAEKWARNWEAHRVEK